jgi:hypothetical protein
LKYLLIFLAAIGTALLFLFELFAVPLVLAFIAYELLKYLAGYFCAGMVCSPQILDPSYWIVLAAVVLLSIIS